MSTVVTPPLFAAAPQEMVWQWEGLTCTRSQQFDRIKDLLGTSPAVRVVKLEDICIKSKLNVLYDHMTIM